MTDTALPAQFSQLAAFVPEWALSNESERFRKLHSTNIEDLRRFYDALLPEMDAVLDYLSQCPVDNPPPESKALFHLAMTFAETAHPLDLGWKGVDFPSAFPWNRFEFGTVSLER